MGDIPLDARRVVDELRSSRREAGSTAPQVWLPSQSFESTLADLDRLPIQLNGHLNWMHHNWDMSELLAPPAGKGLRGMIKRAIHRAIMLVLQPWFDRMHDYLGANLRAVDAVSQRADEISVAELRVLGAVRTDLIDFAHHVDERLND
jgi:hypothetical protein